MEEEGREQTDRQSFYGLGPILKKLVLKLFELMEQGLDLVYWRQDGGSEVKGAFALMKAASRHHANASCFQELKAVEDIWREIEALLKKEKKKRSEFQFNPFQAVQIFKCHSLWLFRWPSLEL